MVVVLIIVVDFVGVLVVRIKGSCRPNITIYYVTEGVTMIMDCHGRPMKYMYMLSVQHCSRVWCYKTFHAVEYLEGKKEDICNKFLNRKAG